ncbi:MAG: hypothetical protein JXR96_01265 [Deltaproteobacteria bacterium]|nr:hypothetical protein [Deltaproteobacteria bacterium]
MRAETMRSILALGCLLSLAACRSTLHGGLDEREANEMLLVLAEAGIEASKSEEGQRSFQIRVEQEDLARAFQALQRAGLPRARHAGFHQVYKERGLVPDRTEAQAIFLSALQEEVAETLESIEGVIAVRVHASLGPARPSPLGAGSRQGPKPERTASVLICHQAGPEGRAPVSRQAVQELVANAIEGLEPARVAVVFAPRRTVPTADRLQESSAGSAGGWGRWIAAALAAVALLAGAALWAWRRFFPAAYGSEA